VTATAPAAAERMTVASVRNGPRDDDGYFGPDSVTGA
jgi:hypothetical protein